MSDAEPQLLGSEIQKDQGDEALEINLQGALLPFLLQLKCEHVKCTVTVALWDFKYTLPCPPFCEFWGLNLPMNTLMAELPLRPNMVNFMVHISKQKFSG